jgi:hypothetical protein
MGRKQLKHARRAWKILAYRANHNLPPLTYKALCAQLGIHYRNAQHFLGIIQDFNARHGLAKLQALAVNAQSALPGTGFAGGRTVKAYVRELLRVYGTLWPATAPF